MGDSRIRPLVVISVDRYQHCCLFAYRAVWRLVRMWWSSSPSTLSHLAIKCSFCLSSPFSTDSFLSSLHQTCDSGEELPSGDEQENDEKQALNRKEAENKDTRPDEGKVCHCALCLLRVVRIPA